MAGRGRLGLADLLNAEAPVDASADFRALLDALGPLDRPILVGPDVHRHVQQILSSWPPPSARAGPSNPPPAPASVARPLQPDAERTADYEVRITDKTTLSILYRYAHGATVEYPESGDVNPVGHLIPLGGNDSRLPWTDFAYSRGAPDGGSGKSEFHYTPLLVDDQGLEVPCKIRHTTCLGMKACPFADLGHLATDYQHTVATRADVQQRLAAARDARLAYSSPTRDIFQSTAAYITQSEQWAAAGPSRKPHSAQKQSMSNSNKTKLQRNSSDEDTPCPKHAMVESSFTRLSATLVPLRYISDHWVDFTIRDSGYDIDYIAAVFTDDREEAERIELAAKALDIGPLAKCKTLVNYTAQRSYCPVDHRLEGRLVRQEMAHLECDVKFRIWCPVDRTKCPYALVTSRGTHRHPIPLPEKTPHSVRSQILKLLQSVRQDLPDMTARRFLRHPAIKSFLFTHFPTVSNPTLSHLHPSLANRAHLRVVRLKKLQDEQLPVHEHYIRLILELDNDGLVEHEEDEPAIPDEKKTRIIICMSPDSSKRLLASQYLQSDIGFKRIIGFDEFEIAAMDRDANTSVVFCRVYVTRHTAAAHQRIFDEINKFVRLDTGSALRWRHLHGQSPEDFQGVILQWGADQHRGQAKGRLGLHLVARAAELAVEQMDMHEPWRSVHTLGPYDHLRRVYRVCKVHNYRNIRTCAVPEPVRQLMRSLACIRHADWEGTIAKILAAGGKAGTDWVRDKESCQFAFPGICWEKSFIPLAVWNAGESNTNLIETVHSDVNREGQYEEHGIRPSYAAVTPVTNACKNVKRRGEATFFFVLPSFIKLTRIPQAAQQGKKVVAHALAVAEHNASMQRAHETLRRWNEYVYGLECLPITPGVVAPSSTPEYHRQLSNARVSARQAQNKYDTQVEIGTRLRALGAGGIILPTRR
ncbi:hypothetical protein B0H12DRAFT_1231133 [Mycena haematopus]|nr:hypothetical protein B0H12DRAFT_1231133 [Mycena haematopus]